MCPNTVAMENVIYILNSRNYITEYENENKDQGSFGYANMRCSILQKSSIC